MNHPDYRTKAGREAEVIAQVDIDGGLAVCWVNAVACRATALQRLIKAGKLKPRRGGTAEFVRYEVVEPNEPKRNPWQVLFDSVRGLVT